MQRPARLDAATVTLLVLPPLFWAGNAIVGRMATGLIAPMALNALRWVLAGLVLLPFVWRALPAHAAVLRREWRLVALLGVLGMGTYNALQYLALTTSTANNVTLIAASAPIFTLMLGALFFGDRLDGRRAVGGMVSVAGVLVVLLHGDPTRLMTLSFVPGDVLMLCAAATWSLYTWLLRARRPDLPPTVLLFAQIVLGSLFTIGCALVERLVFDVQSHFDVPRAWAVLAYVAVLPSVVGYVLWDKGVARAGATLPMFFTNLTPLFAAIGSALLLAEWPHWYHAVALLLILVGIRLAGRRV
ncbi:MAG: DMT family transporter [Burkholderiaceae bacterium]